jgi:hypothetical protein
MEHVLLAYTEVWSEPDAERRKELIRTCWSEESEIFGPGYYFKGSSDVLAEIERFQKQKPGFRVVLTSGFDVHTNWARFTFALLGPDGALVDEGWDLVELGRDGRIRKVVSFWGQLPTAPSPDRRLFGVSGR